jgi:translation initiation factor 1
MTTDIQNLKSFDPFAEADDGGEVKSGTQQNYIHIRIQRMYTYFLLLLCASPALLPTFFPSPRNRARLTSTPHRAQWSQDPNNGPRPTQEIRPKEDPQSHQFACNGTVVADSEMGEVIQLQGDQRKDVQDFLTNKKEGLGLDGKTIKVHGF